MCVAGGMDGQQQTEKGIRDKKRVCQIPRSRSNRCLWALVAVVVEQAFLNSAIFPAQNLSFVLIFFLIVLLLFDFVVVLG